MKKKKWMMYGWLGKNMTPFQTEGYIGGICRIRGKCSDWFSVRLDWPPRKVRVTIEEV